MRGEEFLANLIEIDEPVNDGEREVLRILRDELPDGWEVVSNFSLQQGARSLECDAIAVSPAGWAYLIEAKAWVGQVRGNDAQWTLPSPIGDQPSYRTNPVKTTQLKAKVAASVLTEAEGTLKRVYVQPLVVLVSDTPPRLEGECADYTVLVGEMVSRVLEDPRPRKWSRNVPEDVAKRVAGILSRCHGRLAPSAVFGTWRLIEQIDAGAFWEVWTAVPRLAGDDARPMRLKRYRVDTLLTGDPAARQRARARRDLEALERLAGIDGAAPLVSGIEEADDGSLLVVTEWPAGESLASMTANGPLPGEQAEEVFEALLTAAASVQREGIVHRHLTPSCAHFLPDGRVVLTDFDYARLPTAEVTITKYLADELEGSYTAPEVRQDPSTADKRSDVWSLAYIGMTLFGADPDEKPAAPGLSKQWADAFESALATNPESRPADAELFRAALRGADEQGSELFHGFEPNDELDDRWVVRSDPVGEGGIARVYKVHDSDTSVDYAAKFVRDELRHLVKPAEEFKLLFDVPEHPNIVKPLFIERMSKYRRAGKEMPCAATFLVTRWVDGTRLDSFIAERLPVPRAVEIVVELAGAVRHMHDHGLLHRDLKPQNVIISRDGHAKLVDFNVSGTIDAVSDTEIGTRPYRPPDHSECGWAEDSDVYALGVVLCELLAGRLLRPSPVAWLESEADVGAELRELLTRATAESKSNRITSATDFADGLRAALDATVSRDWLPDDAAFPTAAAEELARPNFNPYQSKIISLFSQSSTTNSGTRGLDEFARWAYVPTKIDRDLLPAVARGTYRLVMITGNAGDGKTAFIQTFEARLQKEGAKKADPRPNGTTLDFEGHRFVTNWDGSQDEGDAENDDVLREFFRPFAGPEVDPPADETRLIAINEGRLLDFVAVHREEFPWLSRMVLDFFTEQTAALPGWLSIVNLNLRALTLESSDPDEVVIPRVLKRFADERLWEPCEDCAVAKHCYARGNASLLRDPVLGARAADRVRQTLDLARLRRRLHITMRDLRSALAFVVAGNRTCDEIVGLVENGERDVLLAGHLYNSLFAASDKLVASARAPEAARDRLLGVTGTVDVAKTAEPEVDARLWTFGVEALPEDPPSVHRSDRELLEELRARLPKSSTQLADRRARADLALLQASLRRKLFLEREDPGWIEMLPYQRLGPFSIQLEETTDTCRDALLSGISQSEGLFSEAFADRVAVRLVADSPGRERSFVLHPAGKFRLDRLDRSEASSFVEYAPDSLILQHEDNPELALPVDLDLFETLHRILDGFTPSREELRGAWLNLRIFKDHVARLPSDSLLLTQDDEHFYTLSRVGDDAVQAEQLTV